MAKKYASLSTLSTFLENLKGVFATKTEMNKKAEVQIITRNNSETTAEDISTLKIHKLSQEQYDELVKNGAIDADALYLTPDEDIDLSPFATIEQLNSKANLEHIHEIDDINNLRTSLDEIRNVQSDTNAALSNKSDSNHEHNDIYYTEDEINAKLADKSDVTHNHDSDYADINHNHDSVYADINHNHNSDYADINHNHNSDYSDINHNHDGVYAFVDHNHDDKYDAKGTASSAVSTHNTSTSAHNDIRESITDLTTKLNNFLDVDDATTDQLSELIALIQDNAADIESITNGKVNVSDIVDNLTTNMPNKPLSAAQGVEIKALLDFLQSELDAKSDWNQNDSTKPDFIKNRPFYVTDPIETVVAQGTIPANGMLQGSASIKSLTLGDTYTVVFDGSTYNNLVCANADGLPSIGSIDFSYEDYPFIFTIQSGTMMAFAKDDATSHTIKVINYIPTIIPLERKYIAEHIDAFAGEKVNGKVYTIDGTQVTAGIGAEVFNDYDTNIASGKYSHAEGMNNVASGMLSHAEGWGTKALGSYSHTEGQETTASESYSHAEGWKTEATNRAAHAEGFATHATGQFSHAEGDNATAAGRASHAEGCSTNATADYSHAEGMSTTATGSSSHAEGSGTQATGYISHAEGWDTIASGDSSHAEGCETTASGDNSHAEGYVTEAGGWNSHAEGWSTLASGEASHAEGYGTTAASDYQHVQGKCNIEDANGKYAHIVGNGSSKNSRSNAHTIDWGGNGWFNGDVYVGGTSQNDGEKLARESSVTQVQIITWEDDD